MTTIVQLPAVAAVGASDLLPLSQAGLLYSVSVSQLTANLQPILSVPTGNLLGRQSIGGGAPEFITVGTGLALQAGALSANGSDHAIFPVQTTLSLGDDVVISNAGVPGLLPVATLRALFSAGNGVSINGDGVIAVTASAIAGPAGPQGVAGPIGPTGPQGLTGAIGVGLVAPAAGNSASSIGASDYVAIWQNGTNAWMPYSQFVGGQTINQLPAAAAVSDSDSLLVAQGSNSLSVQSFGALWTYTQNKLPSFKSGVVELTANTVLDGTTHNNRLLVASASIILTANFANMGSGFVCTLINLSAGSITMGTGISSGSGGTVLPPGGSTTLVGLTYSGGSLVWWSGVVPNAPTLTIATISAPSPNTAFTISGGIFNDAPTALDYSTDGGTTWVAASSPAITTNAFSFTIPGLNSGTYAIRVRDRANIAILGVSNSFTITPPVVAINSLPATLALNAPFAVAGTASPGNSAVRVGLSNTTTFAPASWTNATVSNGAWTASLTPSTAGTFYVWAQQTSATSVQTISSAVSVVAASLTVSAPATGSVGTAIVISGAVSPVGDAVNVQLNTQSSSTPISGWSSAVNTSGNYALSLTPSTAGTYYAWAQDPTTGLSEVSSNITIAADAALSYTINNPGGSYVHGSGTIGLNGGVSPSQAVPTQVVLSTSNITAPSNGWQAASNIYGNARWAIYYPVPPAAGSYYVWVETTTGGSQIVSAFTVTVT